MRLGNYRKLLFVCVFLTVPRSIDHMCNLFYKKYYTKSKFRQNTHTGVHSKHFFIVNEMCLSDITTVQLAINHWTWEGYCITMHDNNSSYVIYGVHCYVLQYILVSIHKANNKSFASLCRTISLQFIFILIIISSRPSICRLSVHYYFRRMR